MTIFCSIQRLTNDIENSDWKILDVQANMEDASAGLAMFNQEHVPGAVFVPENKLFTKPENHGGRHPLPDLQDFAAYIEALGINEETRVLAYGLYAPRFLFMLNLFGIEKTMLLDGGFEAYKASGLPIEAAKEKPLHSPPRLQPAIPLTLNRGLLADVKAVAQASTQGAVLMDCRSPERYRGENEPIDTSRPGRIPSAVNAFYGRFFTENGFLKQSTELAKELSVLEDYKNKECILYCGSGITACYTYFVLKDAGFTKLAIYTGSFSDWISYEENSVEQG